MSEPASNPPSDGRFIMLKLSDGSEKVGWFDKNVGYYYIRGMNPLGDVKGWREIAPKEKLKIQPPI